MLSEARKRANNKYNAKAYTSKLIRFKPEELERVNNYIENHNYTFNSAIIQAILYCAENDIQLNANNNRSEKQED